MQTIASGSILAGLVLATFFACGCTPTKPAPAPPKSAFFTSCEDLDALVSRAATAAGCTLKDKKPQPSAENWVGVGENARFFNGATFLCNVEGGADATEKFLRALKAEVEKRVKQVGANIVNSVEARGEASRIVTVEITYRMGDAQGAVHAHIEKTLDANDQQVYVSIKEPVN